MKSSYVNGSVILPFSMPLTEAQKEEVHASIRLVCNNQGLRHGSVAVDNYGYRVDIHASYGRDWLLRYAAERVLGRLGG